MLATTKRIMTWLYMLPVNDKTSIRNKIACIVIALTVYLANISGAITFFVYFWRFMSTDLDGSLFAILAFSGFGCIAYISMSSFFMRHKTSRIFDRLYGIQRNSKEQ